MPLSRNLKTGPRNHFVDRIADTLSAFRPRLAIEIAGRSSLTEDDIAELEREIAMLHAALDRLSIDLDYSRPALLTPGASNEYMGVLEEAERAAAEAAVAVNQIDDGAEG